MALAMLASAVPPAHAAEAPSAATVIQGGFSAAGGLSAAGPYAAVLVYDLPEAPPPASRPTQSPSAPQESLQIAAALGGPRRLVLAARAGGSWEQTEIARRQGEPVTTLHDETGARVWRVPGRHGRLAAGPAGLLLLAERATADAIWLEATAIKDGQSPPPVAIRGPRDYTFNADLAVDPASGAAFIVAECAVAFGAHCLTPSS